MRVQIPVLSVLATALLASTGCITMGNMTTASALPEGASQFNLEPNLWGTAQRTAETTEAGDQTEEMSVAMFPTFSVSGRYGVSNTVEIGGRAGLGGFELLTKFQLTDPTSDFVVSLAPSAGGFALIGGGGGAGFLSFNLPVLFGFRSQLGELVVGPKLHDILVFGGASGGDTDASASANLLSVGGTVGYAFRMGDLVLMPEFALLVPVYGSVGATVDGDSAGGSDFISADGGVLMQLSFAMMFGG